MSLAADGAVVSYGWSVRSSAIKRTSVRNERALHCGRAIARSHGGTTYAFRLYLDGFQLIPAQPLPYDYTAFTLRLHGFYLTTARPLPYDYIAYGIDCGFCAHIPLKNKIVTIVTNDTLFFACFEC